MPSENFAEQYNMKAIDYMETHDRFYSGIEDESRRALYMQFDFDVKEKRILDAGCGYGKDSAYFHKLGANVYGIDASEEMIKLAIKNHPELENLSVQNFEKTSFPDNFFDVIFSRYALHYAEDFERVCGEFNRILRPDGYLIALIAHPLIGFVAKKDKDYHKREIVEIPIFDGSFAVKAPTHTFSDYLNRTLLGYFDLLNFEEQSLEDKTRETHGFEEVVPDYMMMKLRKRILK